MSRASTVSSKPKIKVAVVGCGKIATNHFNAIASLPEEFELAAVCDRHPDTLATVMTQQGVPGYSSPEALFAATPALDLVSLCSPSGLHAAQTLQAALHKKHVITEKPMATRWSDGLEMVKACDTAGVRLFVVKQNRYQPALQLLRDAIRLKRFGRLYLVTLNVFWTRPQSYYDAARWRGTFEFDGGAFMNQASHYVDLLDWLIGPVQSVQAMMATLARNMEAEDTGTVNIRWRSGTLGSMNFTMLTWPKNLEASLTLLGENGSVRIGGLSANQIDHWAFAEPHEMDEQVHGLKPHGSPHAGHALYYQNVAATLRGETEPEVDGRSGLRSLEILVAAYSSARDNKTVNLPLIL